MASEPMKFTEAALGTIMAEGDIADHTPADFVSFLAAQKEKAWNVSFRSGGGDLGAGLAMGREIRRAGLSTSVGELVPGVSLRSLPHSVSRECDSACNFAFLGGVTRKIYPGSKFGVHRFWGRAAAGGQQVEQDTQQIAGMLVDYIRDMGVSSELYTLMTQGSPAKVIYLDDATLKRLNIVTDYYVTAELLDEDGASVLRLTMTNGSSQKVDAIEFHCGGPGLMARAYLGDAYLASAEKLSPHELASAEKLSPHWSLDRKDIPVPRDHYTFLPPKDGKIVIDVYVPPGLLHDGILKANNIVLYLKENTKLQVNIGVFASIPRSFRTALQTLARSCH
jgi:hypothetical protein